MIEDLANSRYLMGAYAASSDSWENFRLTGQRNSLFEVASSLCGAWSLLSEDDDFFDGLEAVDSWVDGEGSDALADPVDRDDIELQRRRDFERYLDVDALLARELVVLVQAGMDPRHVVRLVSDLRVDLDDHTDPDGRMPPRQDAGIRYLRSEARKLADELCTAQQRLRGLNYDPASELAAGRPPHRSWLRHLSVLGRGLVATAGAASIVGNVAASVGGFGLITGLGLASVVGGAHTMANVFEASRHPR